MRGALREMRVNYDSSPAGRQQADGEIAQLRERIGRSRTESAFELRPPAPKPHVPRASIEVDAKRANIGRILTGDTKASAPAQRPAPILRPSYVEDLPLPVAEYAASPEYVPDYAPAYEEPHWEEAPPAAAPEYYQPAYAPPPPQNALVSPSTAYAAQNSFQQLTDAIMSRAAGERGLEGMTQDLLRGMLKQWLDDHLPQMVEKLVREEIERVARRGR